MSEPANSPAEPNAEDPGLARREDHGRSSDLPGWTEDILRILHQKMFYTIEEDDAREFFDRLKLEVGRPKVVERLLTESAHEKARLAMDYIHILGRLLRDDRETWGRLVSRPVVEDPRLDIFIESGSTLLYVSHGLYEALRTREGRASIYCDTSTAGDQEELGTRKSFKALSVLTNNNLTAWLYLQLPEAGQLTQSEEDASPRDASAIGPDGEPVTPRLIGGQLEVKYHGVFPFYSKEAERSEARNASSENRRRKEEQEGYSQCRLDLSHKNLFLLATSRLSLLYGPTVGSRQNAIFKNATYNACVPNLGERADRVLHLFITARKLIAHDPFNRWLLTEDPSGLSDSERAILDDNEAKPGEQWTKPDSERFYTIQDEVKNLTSSRCFSAFDMQLKPEDSIDGKESRISSPFSSGLLTDYNTQPLKDGTSAVSMGEGRFRVSPSWVELFSKAGLALTVFISFKAKYRKTEKCPVRTCEKPRRDGAWIEPPSNSEEYLDVCRKDLASECQHCWVRREVGFANKKLRSQGIKCRFEILSHASAASGGAKDDSYAVGRIRIGPGPEMEEK